MPPRSWGIVSLLCLLVTAVGPPAYFALVAHVPVRVLLAGAATWAIAVAAKHPLAIRLNRMLANGSPVLVASLQGLLSALLELTAAGVYLGTRRQSSIDAVLAFGAAAGSAEVVYVLVMGTRSRPDPERVAEWARWAVTSFCVRYQTPIERLFALAGHTGSRGMVYLGLHLPGLTGLGFLAAVLATFTAIDGVAYYGHLRKWNWLEPGVCRRAHGFFAALSSVELMVFLAGFRLLA